MDTGEFSATIEQMRIESEEHEALLHLLYDDLLTEYRTGEAKLREASRAVEQALEAYRQANPDRDAWLSDREDFGWRAAMHEWHDRRRTIELAFEDDVLATLDARQQGVWRHTTQRLRRARELPELRWVGLRRDVPDLAHILEGLNLSGVQRDRIGAIEQRYADETDRLLRRFEADRWSVWGRMNHLVTERPFPFEPRDAQEYARLSEQLTGLPAPIVDSMQRFVDEFAAALDPGDREAFLLGVYRVRYPMLYKRSPVEALVEAIDGLDDHQQVALDAIYADHVTALDALRTRMRRAIDGWESPGKREVDDRIERAEQLRVAGEDDPWSVIERDHPIVPLLHERRRLAQEACARIHDLLTPEQLESLPADARLLFAAPVIALPRATTHRQPPRATTHREPCARGNHENRPTSVRRAGRATPARTATSVERTDSLHVRSRIS